MPHVEKAELHRYLANALAPAEREAVEAHLATCSDCSLALAELATEDALLSDALALDPAERAWLESIDLVEPVMAQVAPRFRITPPVIIISLLILCAGYVAGTVWSTGTGLLPNLGSVGGVLGLAHSLLPRLIRLLVWLRRGGLLTTVWPVLAVSLTLVFWRHTRVKETNHHA